MQKFSLVFLHIQSDHSSGILTKKVNAPSIPSKVISQIPAEIISETVFEMSQEILLQKLQKVFQFYRVFFQEILFQEIRKFFNRFSKEFLQDYFSFVSAGISSVFLDFSHTSAYRSCIRNFYENTSGNI